MDLGNINEDRVTKDKHKTSDTNTKPNDAASVKPVSKNVISIVKERNGSKEAESMEAMSTTSFPMNLSNKTTQKNKDEWNESSSKRNFVESITQTDERQCDKSQGNFLNVLSSFRSDMQMIVLDLKSDIHIEKTPKDTLDIEPAVIIEESDTESEADDEEENNIVGRRGHKIDTDPNKEIIARIKRTAKSNITSKWSPGHKRHKRPANENNSSVSSVDNNSQVEQELRLLRKKVHLMKTSQVSRVHEDEAKQSVFVGKEWDSSTKYNDVEKQSASKSSQNTVKHKNERKSKVEFDASEKKTVEPYTYNNRVNIRKSEQSLSRREQYNYDNEEVNNNGKLSDNLQEKKADVEMNNVSSKTVNDNPYNSTKEKYKNVGESKRDVIARNKAHKPNEIHGEGRQENNIYQNHAGKIQGHEQKENIILKGKSFKTTRKKMNSSEQIHKNESEVASKDAAIASDSENNDTANSIETARQSVDSGIVVANILEDQSSTVKHETNRGRVLKTRHSSGDLTRRGQPSSLSSNSSLMALKSKPRQGNPGIDEASKIVDSRKQFYQNGTVFLEEIREHRIMKLFREIQRVRNVSVFPGSYDVIEDKTPGFLMIDYDKRHRIGTFPDREAINRFFVQTSRIQKLCCKINGVSANFRGKEKVFKALKQKQVNSKVFYVNVISMTIEEI